MRDALSMGNTPRVNIERIASSGSERSKSPLQNRRFRSYVYCTCAREQNHPRAISLLRRAETRGRWLECIETGGIFEANAWERKSFISPRKREGRIIICDYGTYLPHVDVSRYRSSLFALDQRSMCALLHARECGAKRQARDVSWKIIIQSRLFPR